jgi:hypothetical protein
MLLFPTLKQSEPKVLKTLNNHKQYCRSLDTPAERQSGRKKSPHYSGQRQKLPHEPTKREK